MTDTKSTPVKITGIPRDKAPEPTLGSEPIIFGSRYSSSDFAHKEWERMWTRMWQIAGRVDQIPDPGNYIKYDIVHESIICIRGDDHQIRAFYNACQHRGNQLVTAEVGTLASGEFQCAYHGWRFSDKGECTWAYCEDDFPQGTPCEKLSLVEISCETWAGFIWFNMDPECTNLRDWLHPVAEHLDSYRMQEMKRTHWVTIEGNWNWKCVQDNFNESYHLPFVHPQTVASMNEHYSSCQFDLYPSGHCRMLMPGGGPGSQYTGKPERTFQGLQQTFDFWEFDPEPYRNDLSGLRSALQQRKRELADSKGYDFSQFSDEQLTDHYHYTIFPNISFSMKPDGCIFLRSAPHPTDPNKCLFDMWYLTMFPRESSEYYSNSMRDWVSIDHQVEHVTGLAGEVSCGPGIDQDVAIWTTQHKGLRSRGYRGEYMPTQENRIRYFHQNLDKYISMSPT